MNTEQLRWSPEYGWGSGDDVRRENVHLVLVFGHGEALKRPELLPWLARRHPSAVLFGCSTAGEIHGTNVLDETVVATAVRFDSTRVQSAYAEISRAEHSLQTGKQLAEAIPHDGLRHAFVLSDGLHVNGSDLVRGLADSLPADVTVTGGLSGDGARFGTTYVVRGERAESGVAAILGLYGPRLSVGYGSLGGWDPFGPERLITRSRGNVLYELDGKSALTLYKRYLGDHAAGLPATGLLFPLSLRLEEGAEPIVRTILSVDERDQSMTFAGDIPVGASARMMKANFERLVAGAMGAARVAQDGIIERAPELAILISCVGRKLVLKQRIEEEVEGVRRVLGPQPAIAGFYSYGEIAPFTHSARCELHNQTMTITTLAEAA